MLPRIASAAAGGLLRPGGTLAMRGFAAAAAAAGPHFCIVGSGPAGFYTADKVLGVSKRLIQLREALVAGTCPGRGFVWVARPA